MVTGSLTAQVKEEISRVAVTSAQARSAELATMIRFAGSLSIETGQLAVRMEVDSFAAATRAASIADELFDVPAAIREVGRAKSRMVEVLWDQDTVPMVRSLGLIDRAGRPVTGLPRQVVSGSAADCEGVWRGAFLARGILTEPGRSCSLEVVAPGPEAALAIVGHARRMGISCRSKEVRGAERVQVREPDAIGALLTRMGAPQARIEWEDQRTKREVRTSRDRLQNFDDANLRRSARAAVAAAARVERAMEILGEDVPEHLADAGRLRVVHRQASLEELGELSDPPISKDAIAGRIRRLLSLADNRAKELGIPDTFSAVTEDLFED